MIYVIIMTKHKDLTEMAVNYLLESGWKLNGPFYLQGGYMSQEYYLQSMIKGGI